MDSSVQTLDGPVLDRSLLHASLVAPVGGSMNFLNEVALRYPDAISLAAGRPYEGWFDLADVHRYLDRFERHLMATNGGDLAAARRTILQYGRTKGVIHDLVAHHLLVDEGIVADPEAIVVTVGCQEALFLVLRALRGGPEDALLAVVPSYVGVHGAARLADLPLRPVRDDGSGIDLDDLERAVGAARADGLRPRALYLVPDYANPSGASLPVERRTAVLDLAARHDLLVLEDNPYGTFGAHRRPTMRSTDPHGRVVYLGTFAKTGIPGARVGFVVADQTVTGHDGDGLLADELAKIKSLLTVNTSPIAQAVIGGKLLENGGSLRRANTREKEIYRRNLGLMVDGLAARFPAGHEVTWNVPDGGFFLLVTLPFEVDDQLLEESARRFGVLWTPVHHFYADRTPRNQVRLSFSHLQPDEIVAGLDRLAAFVHSRVSGAVRPGPRWG